MPVLARMKLPWVIWVGVGILLLVGGLQLVREADKRTTAGTKALTPANEVEVRRSEKLSIDDVGAKERSSVNDEHSASPAEGPQVLVTDAPGRAIEGAAVFLRSGMEDRLLGKTDVRGHLVLPTEGVCDSIIVVHPGYARYVGFGGSLEGRGLISVVLEEGASISGVVTRGSSTLGVGEGVTVHAWPSSRLFFDPLEIALAGAGAQDVLHAISDAEGRFELKGLSRGVDYTLIAAGNGLFSGWEYKGIPAGSSGVQLVMSPLFGLYFSFESPLGPDSVPGEWAERDESARFISVLPQPGVELSVVDDSIARLAGVRISNAVEDTRLIILQSPVPVDRVGPLTLAVHFPGYKPEDIDVYGKPLDEDFAGEVIPLTPLAEAFGAIRLSLHGAPEGVSRAAGDMLAGTLLLSSSSSGGIKIAINFSDLQNQVTLRGVPFGEYELRFVGNLAFFRLPPVDGQPHRISVGPEVASIDLDLSRAACVELELLDVDGWPELENAGLFPYRLQSHGDKRSWLARGTVSSPHRAPGEKPVLLLDPGTYRFEPLVSVVGLQPVGDLAPDGGLQPPPVLDVKPGETASLVWQRVSASR